MKGSDSMGRPKGGKNRIWTQDEKLRIVRRYIDEGIGQRQLAKQEGISKGLISTWIKNYLTDGEDGLQNRRKTGNPFAALTTSKSLSELDRLKLIIAKQEIEIERLKKGYLVKGDGAKKVFVTPKDQNTK